MNDLLFTLNHFKSFRYWRRRKAGKLTVDYRRGPGYYLTVGLVFYDPKKELHEWEMQSGKTGIFKLIDYDVYRDPWDMIKESSWQFIGYKGDKLINDCTFREFMQTYKLK